MIRLNVARYCDSCRFFEAEVIGPEVAYSDDTIVYQSDTIIQCANHERCETLFEQFEKANEGGRLW